jgi:putative FmdB family regulatory protein
MPTYDYECTEEDCQHAFEEFHGINVKRSRCPKCGGKVNKLIGAGGGLIFKGAGFYATENRSQNYIEGKQYYNRQKRKSERLSKNTKNLTGTQTTSKWG